MCIALKRSAASDARLLLELQSGRLLLQPLPRLCFEEGMNE
jgi:hypothetical protein